MELASFEIDTTNLAQPHVVINGEDLSPLVFSVGFEHKQGQFPSVFLQFHSVETKLEGQGVVQVMVPEKVNPAEVVFDFLDAIDAKELENTMLDSMGIGDESSAAVSALSVLKAWASGSRP